MILGARENRVFQEDVSLGAGPRKTQSLNSRIPERVAADDPWAAAALQAFENLESPFLGSCLGLYASPSGQKTFRHGQV